MVTSDSISLTLSEDVLQEIAEIAKLRSQTVEDYLKDSIEAQYSKSRFDPDEVYPLLDNYDDEQLWIVAHKRVPHSDDARYRKIVESKKTRTLTSEETTEFEALVDLYDAYILVRSKALLLLKQRGHDVDSLVFPNKK